MTEQQQQPEPPDDSYPSSLKPAWMRRDEEAHERALAEAAGVARNDDRQQRGV